MLLTATSVYSQRQTDKLDRGLVATVSQLGSGNFISWRIFAEEYYGVTYNLYCNGNVIARNLKVSNYVHAAGNASSSYQVAPVYQGNEGEKSTAVVRWPGDFKYKLTGQHEAYCEVPFMNVTDRHGNDVTGRYIINDISLADVTGDGVVEFLVKRLNNAASQTTSGYPEANCPDNDSVFNQIECYTLTGERLWYIDCGPNLCSRSYAELDVAAYDWDSDGKAEIIMRGADNMIIHTAGGEDIEIGDMAVDTRWVGIEFTCTGREYLLYLNGETGMPYPIGPGGRLWMDYPLPRYEVGETTDILGNSAEGEIWGEGIQGHRPTKHRIGAPFLDGKKASIFIGRGCYTRHKFCALDVNPQTHQLTQRWRWNCYDSASPWYGNGYHNFQIADVDWDGRDEIVYGSMVIDDNGKGLSTTGLGHGDAQHCADLDPYRHGQEQFACNETQPAMNYRDATTSKIYYRLQTNDDDGRALCGNFTDKYPGCVGMSSQSGVISTVADNVLTDMDRFDLNFRIYWDGDLCEEILNSQGTEKQAKIDKLGVGRIFLSEGDNMCNWTKNTPCAQGDIFGDWREEIVTRKSDNSGIRIWTTNYPTDFRIPTLWHDHQYRQAMVWQTCGYNQPPHLSYFLGEMEGITTAPPPFTLTGRTLIANSSAISKTLDGRQLLIYDTQDMTCEVEDGANPYVVIFNVPSWVQGTNSNKTDGTADIIRDYYTCQVTGGAFSGNTRLVKQGDGILSLPSKAQLYTGPTDIWAGTLNFDGKMLHSSLWLNRFARLYSDGGEFRSIKMDYDSKLCPGGANKCGSVTTDSLLLGFGARVIFDLYEDEGGKTDQLNAALLSIEKKNWDIGPKYLCPVFQFVPHTTTGEPVKGKYKLGKVEALKGRLEDIRIEGLGSSLSSGLTIEEGSLYLTVSDVRQPATIIWNGGSSNIWDFSCAENFTLTSQPDKDKEVFVTGDKVIFGDDAKLFNVSLKGDLEADTVLIESSRKYQFEGEGSLVGNTVLVKRGSGSLIINNNNSYTGGTLIAGGTLSVTSLANANMLSGNLGGVSKSASKLVIENGATLLTANSVTLGTPMQMATVQGGIICNTSQFVVESPISGTVLTKRGTGEMQLNVNSPSLECLVVEEGTVRCIACSQPAKAVELAGGTLTENTSSSYAMHITGKTTSHWNLATRANYSNALTGDGIVEILCPSVVGKDWKATRTPISGNWSAFEGTVIPATNSGETRFTLNNAYGMPKATLNIPEGIEVQNSGKTFHIGKVMGKGSLGGICSFDNTGSSGVNIWKVGCDDDYTTDVVVTGGATSFVKVGAGCVTVRGKWDNTGAVRINEGEIRLMPSACLGTGALTVSGNATLSGVTGTISLTNESVVVLGTLQVGNITTAATGAIDFGGKNVSMTRSSILKIGVASAAKSASTGCSSLKGINRLDMNGTIRLHYTTAAINQLAAGDSIVLWKATSVIGTPILESDVIDAERGLYWDTSDLLHGVLRVIYRSPVGIKDVDKSKSADSLYFDISGRRVKQPQRGGLYIVGSKIRLF